MFSTLLLKLKSLCLETRTLECIRQDHRVYVKSIISGTFKTRRIMEVEESSIGSLLAEARLEQAVFYSSIILNDAKSRYILSNIISRTCNSSN